MISAITLAVIVVEYFLLILYVKRAKDDYNSLSSSNSSGHDVEYKELQHKINITKGIMTASGILLITINAVMYFIGMMNSINTIFR